mgnify:CR=1 FL=1
MLHINQRIVDKNFSFLQCDVESENSVNNLFEFGCGSAHNLVYASQIIPNVNLHGLDWSKNSIKIIYMYILIY